MPELLGSRMKMIGGRATLPEEIIDFDEEHELESPLIDNEEHSRNVNNNREMYSETLKDIDITMQNLERLNNILTETRNLIRYNPNVPEDLIDEILTRDNELLSEYQSEYNILNELLRDKLALELFFSTNNIRPVL